MCGVCVCEGCLVMGKMEEMEEGRDGWRKVLQPARKRKPCLWQVWLSVAEAEAGVALNIPRRLIRNCRSQCSRGAEQISELPDRVHVTRITEYHVAATSRARTPISQERSAGPAHPLLRR